MTLPAFTDSIKSRLLAKGFRLADSPIGQYCKFITGPNGEWYGPLTAHECAEKFLGTEPPAIVLFTPLLSGDDSAPEAAKVKGAVAATLGVSGGTYFRRGAR